MWLREDSTIHLSFHLYARKKLCYASLFNTFLINKIYIFFKSQAVILTKLLKETIKRLQGGNPGRHPHRPLPPPPSLLSAAGGCD
jgi:hypothetical protein